VKPYYQDDLVTLLHGDALAQARTLNTGSVQTIVTSPPYFGLRDYGETGQVGAEASVAEYVDGMVGLFRELRRALTDDGTLWLNLGDSYSAGGMSNPSSSSTLGGGKDRGASSYSISRRNRDIPPKNLLGVPWRVALALQADGWILRSDIIWHKPNPMPESVTDRPTKAHEYLFLLAKSPKYFYDAEAIKDKSLESGREVKEYKTDAKRAAKGDDQRTAPRGGMKVADLKNKRTVWTVATRPFGGSHFAVYPPELIRPCVLAGSRPGDTILDPFSGSGTTGMVATQEGRKYIGIDLNSDYLDLSLKTRFAQPVLNLEGIA
jgi:DNA modification methylase